MDKEIGYFSKEQKQTLKLVGILSACLLVLLIVSIALFYSLDAPVGTPQTKYAELPVFEGMNITEAKAALEKAQITYEIIPTESKTANRVEKIEFIGKEEGGKILIEVGTNVKLHANEIVKDKVIYLTFDDGPIVNYTDNSYTTIYHNTGELLDILDQYEIKASFFLAGYQMIKTDRKQYVVDIFDRGHLIACHSFSHDYDAIYKSTADLISDVERFENELKAILGEEKYNSAGKYIRFPGGTNNSALLSKEPSDFINAIRQRGYKIYDWTFLTGDSNPTPNETAEDMIYYMMSTLKTAQNNDLPLILLMHDKDKTKDALPQILDKLISEGYYFDTLDNCPEYTFIK